MSRRVSNRKIIIERDHIDPCILDCPECGLVLRDWEDYVSAKTSGVCLDCKTNKTKENLKDN